MGRRKENSNGSMYSLSISATAGERQLAIPSLAKGEILLRAALGAERVRALRRGRAMRLILVVPNADLLAPVVQAIHDIGHKVTRVVTNDKPGRPNSAGDLSALAGAGGYIPCLHVCLDPGHVPPAFLAVAQEVIRVGHVDGTVVRKAMARCCCGRVPRSVSDLDLAATPFRVLCACIARGTSASRAAKVLASVAVAPAVSADDWLPALVDCYEYGHARTWGLRVMRDIAEWKAGRLAAHELDTSALLVSEPGLGKSFLARILAKSMRAKLVRLDIGELFKGDGNLASTISALRAAFAEARASTPSLLYLDEVDSFPRRGTGDHNDAYFTALSNELLTLLDGVTSDMSGVVVLAATNRPEGLDPALVRPGRLGTVIRIGPPDRKGIEHALRVHLRGALADADLSDIALLAMGSTLAAIGQLVKLARSAARAKGRPLCPADLRDQILERSPIDAGRLRRVAVHEAGHALLATLLGGRDMELIAVSVIAFAGSSGHASFKVDDGGVLTRRSVEDEVIVLLGGRAAEEIVYGEEISAGAGGPEGSDLWSAGAMLGGLEASLGIGGSLLWRTDMSSIHRLLATDSPLRARVEGRLSELYERAKDLLAPRRDLLETIAAELVERRALSGEEINELVRRSRHPRSTFLPHEIPMLRRQTQWRDPA